jgi:DNA-binding NtrC family response regulator
MMPRRPRASVTADPSDRPRTPSSAKDHSGHAPAAARTVLLVEDDPEVRALFASYLLEAGHRVIEAANGADALAALRPGQRIDLLVTDVVTPTGGGLALAAMLRRQQPDVKVLCVSGYGTAEAVPGEPAHLTGDLQTPLTRTAFLTQVAEFLDRAAPPRSGTA